MKAARRQPTPCALFFALWVSTSLPGVAVGGTFSALTYNVAGLPTALGGEGEVNNILVSPLLNGYDVVALQEDFFFHDDLTHAVNYPYVSEKDTSGPAGSGDGLLRLLSHPFTGFQRVPWVACNGDDCFTPKGFSVARHEVGPGAFVDVYNLHAEASRQPADLAARQAGLRQLVDFAEVHSAGNAVLMLGDWNSRYTRVGDILHEVVSDLALTDVWVELQRGGALPATGDAPLEDCTDPAGADCERLDHLLYRSGGGLLLQAESYEVPASLFVDGAGAPLSGHDPVVVQFAFTVPEARRIYLGASLLLGAAPLGVGPLRRRFLYHPWSRVDSELERT